MQKLSNFIDREFKDPSTKKYLDSFNPATGDVHLLIPDSEASDVNDAVLAATKAFQQWSKTTPQQRSQYMLRIADMIESRLEEFAQAESRDQGKPVSLARSVDIPRAVHNFRYFATLILHTTTRSTQLPTAMNYTHRSPIGVCGLISPWNLPLYLLTWKIAPCIAVGNTCVCKPSEITSLTAWMLCGILKEVLPKGVVNMVFGLGASVGAAMTKHPQVPLISFTGGTVTGQTIIRDSAPFIKKLSLELGGKNANIIFDDANLQECIATTVRSSFANQGEICLCGSRVFVQAEIYDKFLSGFLEAVRRDVVVGDPSLPTTTMGALVSKEHLSKVLSYVDIAKSEGGTLLHGGQRVTIAGLEKGYFMQPTIIATTTTQCRVMQEEVFGPVITITPFTSESEAIQYANSTPYGLSASIWTENVRRARRVAEALHVGTVWVNCWMVRDLNVPFGGMKQSGVGREGGEWSIECYTEEKVICLAD
jgi:aminomuconate-semialdehyde/2-hydroxymuconate-6-semialdehyde dehydrogenase